MKLLERYLGRVVVGGTIMGLLLLVSIDTLMDFVNEMDDVGEQGYTFFRAVLYILLTTPQRIYELFPFAMLLGSLLSLGNLAANSELVVMRATGISVIRIIGSALKTGLILTLAVMLLGEFVAPIGEQKAKNLRNLTTAKRMKLSSQGSLWAKDGDRFLHIKDVFPDMRLGRIQVFEIDEEGRLTEFIRAKSAIYVNSTWELNNIMHWHIKPDSITKKRFKKEQWDRLLSPDLFEVVAVKPKHMSATKLYRYVEYLEQNGLDSSQYKLFFWTRFTIPLSGLVMMLLSMPFVFSFQRTGGAGQRLFVGVLIGVVYHLSYQSFIKLGLLYSVPPLAAAVLPIFVTLVIASLFIHRLR